MKQLSNFDPEFTILMPCLNERRTLPLCIREIQTFLSDADISAEILVADNGSTDGSPAIARKMGARVISVARQGYGNALTGGINAARGRYIIMGDCDYSYDFSGLQPFVDALREGYDFVIGNRFPEQWRCVPCLFASISGDSCALLSGQETISYIYLRFSLWPTRFSTNAIRSLHLQCTGMEFATEMIAGFANGKHKIKELPINFRCDKRKGASHLRTFSDGVRHLYFIVCKNR